MGECGVLVHNDCTRKNGDYHTYDSYKLDQNMYFSSDADQFKAANKSFLEKLDKDSSFKKDMYKRHPELADWVKEGNRSTSPAGFTWHHSSQPGVLELVDRNDHRYNSRFYHPNGKGGRAIWGGGQAGRRGLLDVFGSLLK